MKGFITPEEAAAMVKDKDTIALGGFGAYGSPEALLAALEKRFIETGSPRDLTVVTGTCTGRINDDDVGTNRIAREGLISTIYAGHMGYARKISTLCAENKIAAYIFPLGVAMHMFRAVASGQPGVLTRIGLGTYADPRMEGCVANQKAAEQNRKVVELTRVGGNELLYYPAIPVNICFIRGTYSDTDGNVSITHEAITGAELEIAAATHNSGGIVIAQIEHVLQGDMIPARSVRIHNTLIDYVVKSPSAELHPQSLVAHGYNHFLNGNFKCTADDIPPLEMDVRKVIARRGAMELLPGSVVNLGVGVPSGIGSVANEEGIASKFTLSIESGLTGGIPLDGPAFSAAVNPKSIHSICETFDLYDGGYLDTTFLGAAEIDQEGNVNVSKFGAHCPGPGGFINITQNTPRVYFLCTFTSGKTDIGISDGQLVIRKDGDGNKFVEKVQQITFSAEYAKRNHKEVCYLTERAVFKLIEKGLCLTEIAPGADLEKDILDKMRFRPIIAKNLKVMDERIFSPGKMYIHI